MGFNDGQKMCTTSGEPVEQVRAEQTEASGQHKAYIVLCPDERAKGFVRPYRDAYEHVGRRREHSFSTFQEDGSDVQACRICKRTEAEIAHDPALVSCGSREGGCGTVTTMGRALSETYARDPKFYSATFCVICNKHLPVAEFVWTADGEVVGS